MMDELVRTGRETESLMDSGVTAELYSWLGSMILWMGVGCYSGPSVR
jgi:hypothetical protein